MLVVKSVLIFDEPNTLPYIWFLNLSGKSGIKIEVYDDINYSYSILTIDEILRRKNVIGVINCKSYYIFFPTTDLTLKLLEKIDKEPECYGKYNSIERFMRKYYKGLKDLKHFNSAGSSTGFIFNNSSKSVLVIKTSIRPIDRYKIYWESEGGVYKDIFNVYENILDIYPEVDKNTDVFIISFDNSYYKVDMNRKVLILFTKLKTLKG